MSSSKCDPIPKTRTQRWCYRFQRWRYRSPCNPIIPGIWCLSGEREGLPSSFAFELMKWWVSPMPNSSVRNPLSVHLEVLPEGPPDCLYDLRWTSNRNVVDIDTDSGSGRMKVENWCSVTVGVRLSCSRKDLLMNSFWSFPETRLAHCISTKMDEMNSIARNTGNLLEFMQTGKLMSWRMG